MKVLKFGGSSLADARRYLSVSDIVTTTAGTQVAVVLSAPQGVTNALSHLVEQAAAGEDYHDLLAKLDMKLNGICDDLLTALPEFNAAALTAFISEKMSALGTQLKGISMLQHAPEAVTAQILSLGEYVSVNLFRALLQAQGHQASIIDPVDFVLAEGDYLIVWQIFNKPSHVSANWRWTPIRY